jgi:D-tagatose-1,6-bisphosphate aldolase subunit GatZ/KbaZ
MAELRRGTPAALADVVRAQHRGRPRGIASVCSAHPLVLRAAFEQALEDGSSVLVESTSNQVNQDGGYTGMRPADFVAFVSRLAAEAGLPRERVILGGDHLGPHPWKGQAAAAAMARAAEMVCEYVGAGYAKIHLDASMPCADDVAPLADTVVASRTAELAAAAETAMAEGAPTGTVYVIGTEVPTPGGQSEQHAAPAVTRPEDAERTLALTREAFARRGLEHAWERVLALVVQPGVEFGDDVVFPYRPAAARGLSAFAASRPPLVFEAHSTDYQDEAALRALVADHFAVLKVGPELTFAFREAAFALEEIEGELLGGRPRERLSGLRTALDDAMRADPQHWQAYCRGDDGDELRLRRQFGLSDRSRYYWPVPGVQDALSRLFANLSGRHVPPGLLSQYLPESVHLEGPGTLDPAGLTRRHVRRVLARYARACGAMTVAADTALPLR